MFTFLYYVYMYLCCLYCVSVLNDLIKVTGYREGVWFKNNFAKVLYAVSFRSL